MKPTWKKRLQGALGALTGRRDVFAGSEVNRLLADWVTTRLAADDEVRWSLERMRSRARDLERNHGIVRHYLRLLGVNVIGPKGIGLAPQVRQKDGTLNDLLNDRIEDAWADWSWAVTLDGRMTLAQFQRLLLRSVARDGEALVRLWRGVPVNPYQFALEYVDPDQLDVYFNRAAGLGQNEIRMSVEVDEFNRPVAYHLWDKPQRIVGGGPLRKRERIPAEQIVHLYDPDRGNVTRGVTWLASVMVPIKMLGGYFEAELVGARIGAAAMGFFQRKDGSGPGSLPEGENGALNVEANPGFFGVLPEGYEVAQWHSDHPSTAFGAFMKSALREIASGLGVPYNELSNDLDGVSYSSLRAAELDERDLWMTLQQWWIGAFLRRIYGEWLNLALLSGALRLDSIDYRNYLDVKWCPRGWTWVDPLKDVQAAVMAIQAGLSSRQQVIAEQGGNFYDTLEELKAEKDAAELAGVSVTPEPKPKPGEANAPADDQGDEAVAGDQSNKSAGHNGEGALLQRLAPLLRR